MENNYHAILIGVNQYQDPKLLTLKYAEKDCLDLLKVLTHKEHGCFNKHNVQIILGSKATTQYVKQALTRIIESYGQNDTVLIYYSGHGFFAGSRNKVFIGTYDVNTLTSKNRPINGISLAYIREEVFAKSNAKNILLFLDCCFSGAIERDRVKSRIYGGQMAIGISRGGARIAFVSSSGDAVSFEDDEIENSLFTSYILKGLQGEAANEVSGTVTLHSLTRYLSNAMPKEQTPGTFGSIFGEVQLSNPGVGQKLKLAKKLSSFTQSIKYDSLDHPLDYYRVFVERLVTNIRAIGFETGAEIQRHVLNAIRRTSDADLTFIIRTRDDSWTIRALSEFKNSDQEIIPYLEIAAKRALSTINNANLTNRSIHTIGHVTFAHFYSDKPNLEKAIVLIPLQDEKPTEFLIICGVPGNAAFMDDVYGVIMASLYNSSKRMEGKSFDPDDIEASIYDSLRKKYGIVPLKFYEKRLALFNRRLQTTTVYFQPVVYIVPGHLRIDSWEALARDESKIGWHGDPIAPNELFDAAELWGDRFMLDLDTYYLHLSVNNYVKHRKKTYGMRRAEDLKPLSVNVYPNSLTRRVYYEAIKEILGFGHMPGDFIVLEISEKTDILNDVAEEKKTASSQQFHARLLSLSREFGIRFAMDDFGVGHSSISRWLHLKLDHVKIDREILMQDPSMLTIRYVIDLAHQKLGLPKIILEGYDIDSPISLKQLHYDLGVKYVQGFNIGKGMPHLYRLEDLKEKELMNQINQGIE
jgi:EAL domain-containing protein (putative c-di-GMP-specific phosphodiesterase class I)